MRIRNVFASFFAALLLLAAAVTVSAQMPDGVKKITSVEGITEYRLDNGLKVLLFPDNTKQTVTVNVTYLVGSKHENYGETGMAHLLEHLVFKGTPKHPNIPAELTKYGASPNGTTNSDRTNYFETVASTDENLEWALDLEADRMVNSFIAKKDLDSEFSVVRNELESGENSPLRVLFQRSLAVAYDWHNYGKTTIGARSDLENVPIDRLKAFYKKYYQPDNAVLLVAGKFDEMKTLNIINKKFGVIPKPERKLPKFYTVENTQDGERTVAIRRSGDAKWMTAGYHVPPGSHPEAAAVAVLVNSLTNSPSGRLYKSLVESKKAARVFDINFEFKEPSYLMFYAQLNKETEFSAAQKAMLETLETIGDKPMTKEEVERAKTSIIKNIDLTLNDPNRVGLGLSEFIALGDWRLFFLYRDRVKAVTQQDVTAVAEKYLKRSNRTLAMFIPTEPTNIDRAEVPNISDEDITAMVKDYKGGEAVAQGEAFDPSPENIDSRTSRTKIGGLKVAFLPKENRGDTVFANMRIRFGNAQSLMNRGTAGTFAAQMLTRGTLKKTRQEIQDEFDRLKARVNVSGGATSANVSIETTRQNLPDVIKLVAEILKEPAFPESEFEVLKKQQITALESQKSNPQSVAINALQRHVNRYEKGDPRYSGTFDESIANLNSVTLAQVKDFYKDFYGASVGEAAFVGDFDPKVITPLIQDLFGNWKSPGKYERLVPVLSEIPPVNQKFETPDKANAFFIAGLELKMRDDNPDYPAMFVGNYMLGGGFLNSRLASRIRQKEGLSYGVGSQFSARSEDEYGTFIAFAIYAPQNLVKLEAAFKDEIRKAITAGFTKEEVEAAKKGLLLAAKRQRATDSNIAAALTSDLYLGRSFQFDKNNEEKIENLTAEEVNAAVKKYLTPDKISIFKAGDFANAKASKEVSSSNESTTGGGKYAALVGTYSLPRMGEVQVSEKGGKLIVTAAGQPPIELVPVKDEDLAFDAKIGGRNVFKVNFKNGDDGTEMNLLIQGNTVTGKKVK
ncbi:MAG: insulinase family protein [Pyrinomonadaceae bacterium]|nr:insulinase family protein [Pyrinomonadaceae bacterium]